MIDTYNYTIVQLYITIFKYIYIYRYDYVII